MLGIYPVYSISMNECHTYVRRTTPQLRAQGTVSVISSDP